MKISRYSRQNGIKSRTQKTTKEIRMLIKKIKINKLKTDLHVVGKI
jgi:hypothetical protein